MSNSHKEEGLKSHFQILGKDCLSERQYCNKIVSILNSPQVVQLQNRFLYQNNKQTYQKKIISYKSSYKIIPKRFSKQHDNEYLQVQQLLIVKNKLQNRQYKILLKINFIYSIAYSIPLLLFMPYCLGAKSQAQQEFQEEIKPFGKQQLGKYEILNLKVSEKIRPEMEQTGVFVMQNHINGQYYYTLHHCEIGAQQMSIQQLIPFYFALINCHPQL